MRFVPFLLAVALSGTLATGAGAAPASTSGVADLCSVAKGVAASITASGVTPTPTTGASITSLEKQLKVTYTKIKDAEPIVLANAPSSLKGDLQKVFAFDNTVFADLSKAHWNILAFAKNARSLEAGVLKIKPDLLAIKAYFAKCKA